MNVKVLSLLLFLSGYVLSQDKTLSLAKVVQLSVEQNTGTLLSKVKLDQKNIALEGKKYSKLPEAGATVTGTTGGTMTNDAKWASSTAGSLSASYTYDPTLNSSINSLKAQSSAASYSYKQAVNDITSSAVTAYIKTAYAQKAIGIAMNNLDYQKAKLSQIEEFKTAGKISISDVLQQQTTVAESEASLLTAQQVYQKSLLSLYTIAGMDIHSNLDVDTNEMSGLLGTLKTVQDSINGKTIDSVPEVLSQEQTVKASEYSVQSARRAWIPSVKGSAGTDVNYSGGVGKTHTWSDPTGRLSLSLSYPLFDQYRRKLNLRNETLNLQSAQLQLTDLRRNTTLEFEQSLYDLEIARKQVSVSETRLTAAKQSLDAITERYNAGASTLVEVAMVNNSYLSAVNSKLTAESSLLVACVNLLKVTGEASAYFGVEK